MNEALAQSEPKTKWWTELAWQLYERLPATADELLKRRYRYLPPFKNLRIPYRSSRMPGLKRLYLIAASGWKNLEDTPPRTCLIDPTDAGGLLSVFRACLNNP